MPRSKKIRDNDENIKCRRGEIVKSGYHRKGYQRKQFRRSDGTLIPPTYVSATYVPPTCVHDMGRRGKGPKILPPPGDEIHLSKYGWSVNKPQSARRAALRAASRDYSILAVLRRLNLLRNYQAIPRNKEIFTEDVEYMKKLYAPISRSRKNQRGGQNADITSEFNPPIIPDPVTTDIFDEFPHMRNNLLSNTDNMFAIDEFCEGSNCNVKYNVFESYTNNGHQIQFYTLGMDDAPIIWEFDKKCLSSASTLDIITTKLTKYAGNLIGLKSDGILQGYFEYEIIDPTRLKIVWFCANSGFENILENFIVNFAQKFGYNSICINIINDENLKQRLDFWTKNGYNIEENTNDLFYLVKII